MSQMWNHCTKWGEETRVGGVCITAQATYESSNCQQSQWIQMEEKQQRRDVTELQSCKFTKDATKQPSLISLHRR